MPACAVTGGGCWRVFWGQFRGLFGLVGARVGGLEAASLLGMLVSWRCCVSNSHETKFSAVGINYVKCSVVLAPVERTHTLTRAEGPTIRESMETTTNTNAEKVREMVDRGSYEAAGRAALDAAGGSMRATLSDTKAPAWADEDKVRGYRPHWRVTLSGPGGRTTFDYWDSIANGQKGAPTPSAYDVLCCLTWYDPGTFEQFCSEYGYDTDSRKAERTYKAVRREYERLCRVFPSEADRETLAEVR